MNILLIILLHVLAFSSPFPTDFDFGVANAPGQTEDRLQDIWADWGALGNIRSWQFVVNPANRLEFWTKPETEIDLASNLGVSAFRLGVDWGRVMPSKNKFDDEAIARYREILLKIKKKNMKVMLTLWHHSVPKWIQEQGGWHNPETKKDFIKFSLRMVKEFKDDVDWWITFNEANVWVTMAYSIGIWPPGEKSGPLSLVALGPLRGDSVKALDLMSDAHNEVYKQSHAIFPLIKMGLAHNMANYTSKNFFDRLKASFIDDLMNWRFPEKTRGHVDFFGFNYYGAEWISGSQIALHSDEEYSEAGRAIDVNGLYNLLHKIHLRFPGLPIIITENGIADANDSIRGSYLIEHLVAIKKALDEGVPVKGYFVWSLTDNLEWSDGYCPKFGLVEVDRQTMSRKRRSSFNLYRSIIQSREIHPDVRGAEWVKVKSFQGKDRPFCRGEDGITAFDAARARKFSNKDWRFQENVD
jgi:beta-glucosidase/6-phospho-beta-glucosidase/beta-galactosidase